MFLESSRYYKLQTVKKLTPQGKTVTAVKLRRLPDVQGDPFVVESNDRLDIISQRQYSSPDMFWHIADANTELDANDLVKIPGRIINVPES